MYFGLKSPARSPYDGKYQGRALGKLSVPLSEALWKSGLLVTILCISVETSCLPEMRSSVRKRKALINFLQLVAFPLYNTSPATTEGLAANNESAVCNLARIPLTGA